MQNLLNHTLIFSGYCCDDILAGGLCGEVVCSRRMEWRELYTNDQDVPCVRASSWRSAEVSIEVIHWK